jgi:transposase-like protein
MNHHNFQPPMHPAFVVCPNCGDDAHGRIGIHSRQERRYKCHQCGKTFAETIGTPLYGLKYPGWLAVIILSLLAYGCPVPAIVMAFGLDERTVAAWQQKAGQHTQAVQQQEICNGQVDLGQVQGDELYIKSQCGAVWLATSMTVFSRLFVWGAVSVERSAALVTQVVAQTHAAALPGRPILWVVDGFAGWTQAIRQLFRRPVYTGQPGRPRLVLWSELHVVQVVKRFVGRRLASIDRRLIHGSYAALEAAMFWTGCVYNFSHVHASLDGTPAMAAGLTDHVWSVRQLLFCYRFRREALHAIL